MNPIFLDLWRFMLFLLSLSIRYVEMSWDILYIWELGGLCCVVGWNFQVLFQDLVKFIFHWAHLSIASGAVLKQRPRSSVPTWLGNHSSWVYCITWPVPQGPLCLDRPGPRFFIMKFPDCEDQRPEDVKSREYGFVNPMFRGYEIHISSSFCIHAIFRQMDPMSISTHEWCRDIPDTYSYFHTVIYTSNTHDAECMHMVKSPSIIRSRHPQNLQSIVCICKA